MLKVKFPNPYLLSFLAVYIINLWVMYSFNAFPVGEAISIVVVFGILLSGVSWVITKNYTIAEDIKPGQPNELRALAGMVVYVFILLYFGNNIIPYSQNTSGWQKEIVTIIRKFLVFVILPFLFYHKAYGFTWCDFGLQIDKKGIASFKNWKTLIVIGGLVALLNFFAGSGAKDLRNGIFSYQQIIVGMPLIFCWLLIEVGLVEEFFFRGLLQNRLAVILKSEIGALFVTAFIFGIVHAPGMYLRGAGVIEGLGATPSLLVSIGYCIAIQSIPAFFFGILWLRTRNLWILIGIHAAMDLISNFSELVRIWGF